MRTPLCRIRFFNNGKLKSLDVANHFEEQSRLRWWPEFRENLGFAAEWIIVVLFAYEIFFKK